MSESFLNYANSFQSIAKLRLEGITALLDKFGNPQKQLKFIHVAGTNGKGSVCAFLESIFIESGLKCGKYSSPELVSLGERIQINRENISDNDIKRLISKVEESALKVQEKTGDCPTQFEIWTAAAFCYFLEHKCDIVVLETGLGGERDATNVIDAPEYAVITRIATDHTSYLGDTIGEIASAKAGIIKNGTKAVITTNQLQEAYTVLKDKCTEQNALMIVADCAKELGFDGMCEVFSYKEVENIKSGLCGTHQIENATLAIETALLMGIDKETIKKGINKAEHKGRFETVCENPLIIYDGAHNLNGMESLVANLERYFENESFDFLIAFMADKDVDGALKVIMKSQISKGSVFNIVKVKNNDRALDACVLAEKIEKLGAKTKVWQDAKDAFLELKKSDRKTVICGSLYLYKDVFA